MVTVLFLTEFLFNSASIVNLSHCGNCRLYIGVISQYTQSESKYTPVNDAVNLDGRNTQVYY